MGFGVSVPTYDHPGSANIGYSQHRTSESEIGADYSLLAGRRGTLQFQWCKVLRAMPIHKWVLGMDPFRCVGVWTSYIIAKSVFPS